MAPDPLQVTDHSMKINYDAVGLAALTLSTSLALLLVPDLTLESLKNPAESAAVGTCFTFTVVVVLRGLGRRGSRMEQYLFAIFLGVMPLVYIQSRIFLGGSMEWLYLEIVGLVIFGALAVLGLVVSPWFTVVGLAAHGLGWDSWHPGRAAFMPSWYAGACLSIDLGWAIYAATQVQAFRDARLAWKPARLNR